MFKRFNSLLTSLIDFLYFEKKCLIDVCNKLDKLSFHDYKYIVEICTQDSVIRSVPLDSLKEVNGYLNIQFIAVKPTNIKIEKVYDDGL